MNKPNYFEQLEKKLTLENNETEEINKRMQEKLKVSNNKEQYERYTHSYMKMVMHGEKKSGGKMSIHRK